MNGGGIVRNGDIWSLKIILRAPLCHIVTSYAVAMTREIFKLILKKSFY